jgi:hypothetical protein
MEEDKMVLIAQILLESSIGAYVEWLVDELNMTTNKIEYKDALLVMLPTYAIKPTSQIALHILEVFSFLLTGKSCRVQLST